VAGHDRLPAFGLCASSVYILNDLMDVEADRHHPRKRFRPFASGALSTAKGIVFAALLLAARDRLATYGDARFRVLAWGLLRAHAGLYLRPEAQAVGRLRRAGRAPHAPDRRRLVGGRLGGLRSGFSRFRCSCSSASRSSSAIPSWPPIVRAGATEAQGRGYRASDLQLVQTMGVAAGFNAVLLMALTSTATPCSGSITGPNPLARDSRRSLLGSAACG
jgi:hypothetical protein